MMASENEKGNETASSASSSEKSASASNETMRAAAKEIATKSILGGGIIGVGPYVVGGSIGAEIGRSLAKKKD